MRLLSYTLLSDGSSDRALMPILNWLLRQHCPESALEPQWADPSRLESDSPKLVDRIKAAVSNYPCDILFIHRDAEKHDPVLRRQEVIEAVKSVRTRVAIPIVPVRMTEAWLLGREPELRIAAGNPAGTMPLELPPLNQVEHLPNPKETLFALFRKASELSSQRLRKFRPHQHVHRLADLIEDFSYLRTLPAFQQLEADLVTAVSELQSRD